MNHEQQVEELENAFYYENINNLDVEKEAKLLKAKIENVLKNRLKICKNKSEDCQFCSYEKKKAQNLIERLNKIIGDKE